MKKEEINKIIYVTFFLALLGPFSIFCLDIDLLSFESLRIVKFALSFTLAFWFFYLKWGWKLPLLNRIFNRPNINGTWFGTYESISADGYKEYKGDIAIIIKQELFSVRVKSLTDKALMYSYSETFLSEKENDKQLLNYLYSQNKIKPTAENVRRGASELSIIIGSDIKNLSGEFWTIEKTTGFLDVNHICKQHCQSFDDALKIIQSHK